jgi:excisionase family DNA binding protein
MNAEIRVVGEHLLTVQEVANVLKLSKRTVWRWVAQGRLPTPVRYSRTCVRWKASAIQAHLDALPS